jgi:hypothetical protein
VILGHAFLEEGLGTNALDEALENHRTTAGTPQRPLGDGQVVPDDVELGEPRLGEDDLARVADAHLVTVDLEDLGGR